MFKFTTKYGLIFCCYFLLPSGMRQKEAYMISEIHMEATMNMIVTVICDAV